MSFNRTLGNLGKAIDSASAGTFLQRDDATDVDFVSIEYSDLSGTPTALDSAAATNLIDSAYIQLRQGALGGGGLDSAAVTTLIDSNYVSARTSNLSSGFFMYDYVATAGQTTFQDSDANGNILSYGNGGILVFYNGILMRRGSSYDYTEGTNSVVLNNSADSGANITISKWTASSGGSVDITWYGDRQIIFMGYDNSVNLNNIEYFSFSNTSSTDFGDLTVSTYGSAGFSDGTRGVRAGGASTNTIDYITIATPGNATDFGDHANSTDAYIQAIGDGTYGVYGEDQAYYYVTVQTTGNASSFGSVPGVVNLGGYGGAGDGTYGIFTEDVGSSSVINSLTIATTGSATNHGNLLNSNSFSALTSDDTYAVAQMGVSNLDNTLNYITIVTGGTAADFGNLYYGNQYCGASSDGTYGYFTGGSNSPGKIQYITIATPGNATALGDLVQDTAYHTGTSGSPS